VKAFHFCFGIGAFTTPLLLKAFGVKAYIGYAVLTVPIAGFLLIAKEVRSDFEAVSVNEQTMNGSIN
jgi:hypothetical protein